MAAERPSLEQRRFPAMGSSAHVVVVDGRPGSADAAIARLEVLEASWSRFRASSELSRVNAAGGAPCVVSPDFVRLVSTLREAWVRSAGRFDPTVHDAMHRVGYATTFPTAQPPATVPDAMSTPGCEGVFARGRLVQLPPGVRLDPGGLGKGLAADIVVGELLAGGAAGAMVNVGGDLRVAGLAPDGGDAWLVAVADPAEHEAELAVVELADGGVATSTSARRRWRALDGAELHHLLDPTDGRPADRPWIQATAVASTAWWAEVVAKVAYLDGEVPGDGTAALMVGRDGSLRVLGDPAWFDVERVVVP